MSDYISREDAVKAIESYYKERSQRSRSEKMFWVKVTEGSICYDLENAMSSLPSADVRENVRGEWLEKEVNDDIKITEWQSARCSNCGLYHTTPYMYYFDEYNYCPNCGADMRGEEDG